MFLGFIRFQFERKSNYIHFLISSHTSGYLLWMFFHYFAYFVNLGLLGSISCIISAFNLHQYRIQRHHFENIKIFFSNLNSTEILSLKKGYSLSISLFILLYFDLNIFSTIFYSHFLDILDWYRHDIKF